jgi:hypothetical protein
MASNYQLRNYIVTPGASPLGPYIVPPSFTPQQPLQPLLINIFSVGNTAVPKTCAIDTGQQNVDFSMQWQIGNNQTVFAQVTVSTAHVYSDAPADRQILLASFRAFCSALQVMEQTTQCLIPGGAAIIANQVAGALPLRVDEILAYYYGFTPSFNYVDLQPGMRLRIETGSFQFVTASSALNAFTMQGQAYCAVTRNSNQQLYFNPFMNGLTVSVAPTSPPQIGNVLDLAALGSRRYFRLIYPSPMNNPTIIYTQPGLGQNVTLLGADTPADLANATSTYLSTKTCTAATPGNQPIICAYFTGRASVVPEIPVTFMGQLTYVPLGTTVQHMIDLYNVLPPNQVNISSLPSLAFYRYAFDALSLPPNYSPSYGSKTVSFSPTTVPVPILNSTGSLTQWDLPLVKSDSLSWARN